MFILLLRKALLKEQYNISKTEPKALMTIFPANEKRIVLNYNILNNGLLYSLTNTIKVS